MSDLSHATKPVTKPASTTARRRGPHTARGKAHSARNALRHGLNVPVAVDPATAAAVEALTKQIIIGLDGACRPDPEPTGGRCAPSNARSQIAALAQAVAEAQVDLLRIRHVRHDLIAAAFIRGSDTADLAQRLAVMARYERRVLSRRKFAIRDFDAARLLPIRNGSPAV